MPKIYTKRGDEGYTKLLFGDAVSKSDPRTEAYGSTDAAVSAMGLARALCQDGRVREILLRVQREMFTVGAELATDPANREMLQTHFSETTADMVTALEADIDVMLPQMKLPRAFIVPGASAGSGALDLARSMLRTSERRVVALHEAGEVPNPEVLRYLNRLSDLLFVLARFEDRALPFELTTGEA